MGKNFSEHLKEINELQKKWQIAYDRCKALENSTEIKNRDEKWHEIHLAWCVQSEIRKIIEKENEEFVKNNIVALIQDIN